MHYIFLLARIYPYWAMPLSVVLFQLGLYFHRRKSGQKYASFGGAVLLVVGIIAWFACRGDLYSDSWVRSLFGG